MREDIHIVPFAENLVEGYLDLAERDDSVDPLYGGLVPRDERESRLRLQASSGVTRAHFVAIKGENVVASAKANMPPQCGDEESKAAILSMMVSPEHRREGIGTSLLGRICKEMESQNMDWIEIGVLDSWKPWRKFLEKNGFAPHEKCCDVVLSSDIPVHEYESEINVTVRPVHLPEERGRVIAIYNAERSKDLPKECAVVPGKPTWWEVEPWASSFEPESLLVAVDDATEEIVGYVSSGTVLAKQTQGFIHYIDVLERLLGTGLRKRLLTMAVLWLRAKGVVDVRSRVHPEYRDEESLFGDLGFELCNSATVWRRSTSTPVA